MPVLTSLCTYSPSSIGGSPASSSSKYSSILPTTSSLSYGNYKPLSASSSSGANSRASLRSTASRRYEPSTGSSGSGTGSLSRGSFTSRYNLTASSPSSYSPSSTGRTSSSGSSGLYKPLDSAASYSPRFGSSARYSSGSSSSNSLSSTASSLTHDNLYSAYSAYKSPSSSSAYSSGSSLSSTSSSSGSSANYAPKNRRPSYTSYSTGSSLASSAAGARSSSALSESPLPPGVPGGLINLGNTCYMNASLQAVYSIDPLRELLLSSSFRASSDKELTTKLAELFKLMRSSNATASSGASSQPVSPADFKYAFSRHQSKFSGFAQQDAQEFLRYLINGVHEEFNRANLRNRRSTGASTGPKTSQEAWQQYRQIVDDSPLVDLLVGQLCSTITCTECQHQSHCWDPFWDLSLPLSMRRAGSSRHADSSYSSSSFSLRYVIDEFTSKETLEGDERPTCARCKRPTRSTKQISWARLPQVLILHLKKFTNDGFKLSSPDIQIDKQLTFNATTYHLKASIAHHGHSSSSGHYTSHCEYSGRWFHFDDGRVRDVTNTFDTAKLQDAYVLFYTQTRSASPAVSRRLSQSKL